MCTEAMITQLHTCMGRYQSIVVQEVSYMANLSRGPGNFGGYSLKHKCFLVNFIKQLYSLVHQQNVYNMLPQVSL